MITMDTTALGPVPASALSVMRHSGPLMRSAACTVILTFGMWILAPTAQAAQADTPPAKAVTTGVKAPTGTGTLAPATPEAKLSAALNDLDDALWRADEAMKKGDQAKADPQLSRISKLHQTIVNLEPEVMQTFAANEAHIKKHKLAPVIMDRHQKAVASVKTDMAALKHHLATLQQEKAKGHGQPLHAAIKKTRAHLNSKQQKTKRRAFDPDNMPRKVMQPIPGNKPKKKREEFLRAGLTDLPTAKLAALGDFTFDQLPGADDPAYLAETDEVLINDAIKAKAAELGHDPVKLYNWVRNTIEWLPTWGATQTSAHTLGSGKGNAMDISSLLIALYRASGIPARYVHGTIDVPIDKYMNWAGGFTDPEAAIKFAASGGIPADAIVIGGKITHARMEHVWVEAAMDFEPSRGAINKAADSWVQMDGSFKQYFQVDRIDAIGISGLDVNNVVKSYISSGHISSDQTWTEGFDSSYIETAETLVQTKLRDWADTQPNGTSVELLTGGTHAIIQNLEMLPGSLPNKVVTRGVIFDHIPDQQKNMITVTLGKYGDYPNNSTTTLSLSSVNNKKLAISFKPATPEDEAAILSYLPEEGISDILEWPSSIPGYMISVLPLLSLEDETISVGNTISLGSEFSYTLSLLSPGRTAATASAAYPAGSFLALTIGGGSWNFSQMRKLRNKAKLIKETYDSGNLNQLRSLNPEEIVGDIFFAGAIGYFAKYLTIMSYFERDTRAKFSLLPSGGNIGYVPFVSHSFGIPISVSTGGIQLDLNLFQIASQPKDGENENSITFSMLEGIFSSILEHEVPEQLFDVSTAPEPISEGVSAVKALQIALSNGQKIYSINKNNQSDILHQLSHDSTAMNDINNALSSNKSVVTHTDPISIPGWTGSGYIILDTESGGSAYMISGSANGGYIESPCTSGTNSGPLSGGSLGVCSDLTATYGSFASVFIPTMAMLGVLVAATTNISPLFPKVAATINIAIMSYLLFIESACKCGSLDTAEIIAPLNAILMVVFTRLTQQLVVAAANKYANPELTMVIAGMGGFLAATGASMAREWSLSSPLCTNGGD